MTILKDTLDQLKTKYNTDNNFKNDFKNLIKKKIEDDNRIRQNLKESCKNIVEYFEGKKSISGIETIALIYAERNMYYHNGEDARMGMKKYKNRQFLIRTLTTGFYKHILLLATMIIKKGYDEKMKINNYGR